MRTLSATGSCGPSEVEDEDGDGRDGAGSASDEDSVGCSRWRSARSCPQDSSRRAADRWVSLKIQIIYFMYYIFHNFYRIKVYTAVYSRSWFFITHNFICQRFHLSCVTCDLCFTLYFRCFTCHFNCFFYVQATLKNFIYTTLYTCLYR